MQYTEADGSIKIYIKREDGTERELEIPLGIPMNLMEVLKGEGENIQGVCGGMAICATCVVEILDSEGVQLPEMEDYELSLLESLPEHSDNNRLACQLKIGKSLNGLRIRVPEEVFV